jgi:TolB-like protein
MVMQNRTILIFLSLLMLILSVYHAGKVLAAAAQEKSAKIRLAVFYFDNESLTDRSGMEPLRKGLADTLISDLSRLCNFQIVERTKMDSLLAELKLGHSGLIDMATAQRVGKFLGARMLLMGCFTVIGDTIRIDARVVDAETGLVVKAEEVSGDKVDLFALEERVVAAIAEGLSEKLTAEEKLRLHRRKNIPFPAIIHYSQGLEYLDSGRYAEAARAFEQSLAAAPDYREAGEKLKEVRQKIGGKESDLAKGPAEAGWITVAVFPFEDIDPSADSKDLGGTIAERLADALAGTGQVKIVDRVQLKKLLEDVFKKARPGDQGAFLSAAKMSGAQCLILGSFARFRDQIRINTRIVRSETGEVLATGKASGNVGDLSRLQESLVQQMIPGLKTP